MLWLISTSISSSPAMRIDGKAASSEFDGGKLKIRLFCRRPQCESMGKLLRVSSTEANSSISSLPAMRIDGKAASSEFDRGKLKIMRVVTLHTLFLGSLSTAEEILLRISWRWPDRSLSCTRVHLLAYIYSRISTCVTSTPVTSTRVTSTRVTSTRAEYCECTM